MKKEDLKAAITKNFVENDFETAMELNKDLFQEYENVAGKRSLSSLIAFYRKKSSEEPEEIITQEDVATIEDVPAATVEAKEEEEEPEYQFVLGETLDTAAIGEMMEKGNKALNRYCIVKEEFKQVSDSEQFIKTSMMVKEDGFGWKSFEAATNVLGGKKGITKRTIGSFWRSECGLPVGEEITKSTIYKIGEALRKFAFRNNASAITCVTSY